MKPRVISVKLDCCGTESDVVFDALDCPIIAPKEIRTTVICSGCDRIAILSLKVQESLITQEIVNS